MEEASNASSPVSFIAMGAYFFALLVALNDPGGTAGPDRDVHPAGRRRWSCRSGRRSARSSRGRSSCRRSLTVAAIWALFVVGGRVYSGAVLQTGARIAAARRVAGVRAVDGWPALRPGRHLEQPRRPAGVPEDDRAREPAVADARDQPGQRLRRVDRVDEDALGPGEELASPRRPPAVGRAVAVAELVVLEDDSSAGHGDARERREPLEERDDRRAQLGRRRGDRDPDDRGRGGDPAAAAPSSTPAWVPPVADGSTTVAVADPGRGELVGELQPGEDLAGGADRPRPADADRRTAGGRPPAGLAATASTSAARSARSSVAVTWTRGAEQLVERAGSGPRRRPAAAGRSGRDGPSSPARAPAAAVSRQWFDQRRPDVTSVSAPSASAAPTRNSRLRSLLPPNASGRRSSRLIQTSAPPPSAAENRRSGVSGDGPSSRREPRQRGDRRAGSTIGRS